jgi:hypothetical protein
MKGDYEAACMIFLKDSSEYALKYISNKIVAQNSSK